MAHNEIKGVTESKSLKMNWVGDNWEENGSGCEESSEESADF